MNWLYSCKRLGQLLSQRMDERLGLVQAVRLRLHLSVCANCSSAERQLAGVNAATADLFAGGLVPESERQSPPQSNGPRGRAHRDD